MTNFEYYKDEIKKYIDDMANFTVSKGEIIDCDDVRCGHCEINDSTYSPCEIGRIKWLYEEHKESQKLTVWEYNYLLLFKKGYMLRNIDEFRDDILIYRDKPVLSRGLTSEWHASELKATIMNAYRVFNFIEAGDEPYSIEEMLTWEHEEEQ